MATGNIHISTERTEHGVALTGWTIPDELHFQFGNGGTLRRWQRTPFKGGYTYRRADLANEVIDELQASNQALLEQVWALTKERDELAERLARS